MSHYRNIIKRSYIQPLLGTVMSCFSFTTRGGKPFPVLTLDLLFWNRNYISDLTPFFVIFRAVLFCKFFAIINVLWNKKNPHKSIYKSIQNSLRLVHTTFLSLECVCSISRAGQGYICKRTKQWSITCGRRMRKTLALLRWEWLLAVSSDWLYFEQR